ncbi:MAG: VTT domain-containing protein [Thermomicrobiales bacterium]|nr:VTT domain-containing protein [Thermomicrobiales bacterium]
MFPGDLDNLLQTVGYIGIFLIIFAETGLLIGLFLPGDSLLFTAGFLASQGVFDIWILVIICVVAAIVGDALGYSIGKRYGRQLFKKPESRLFKPKNLVLAEQFFLKHGGRAIILARFIPFARTFVPVIAGISAMPYRHFAMFNVAGALLWGAGLTLLGYFLGSVIPSVDHYLLPAIALILLISVLPSAYHLWKEKGDQIKDVTRVQLREIFGKGEPEAAPASSNEPTDSNSQS